jgi:hypothetical protein
LDFCVCDELLRGDSPSGVAIFSFWTGKLVLFFTSLLDDGSQVSGIDICIVVPGLPLRKEVETHRPHARYRPHFVRGRSGLRIGLLSGLSKITMFLSF